MHFTRTFCPRNRGVSVLSRIQLFHRQIAHLISLLQAKVHENRPTNTVATSKIPKIRNFIGEHCMCVCVCVRALTRARMDCSKCVCVCVCVCVCAHARARACTHASLVNATLSTRGLVHCIKWLHVPHVVVFTVVLCYSSFRLTLLINLVKERQ